MEKLSSKLRIAVLIDAWLPFWGGGQVHVKQIAKRLKQKNCDVVIFHSLGSGFLRRLCWNIQVIPGVIRSHRQKPFDLIHAHAYTAGVPGKILSWLLKTPIVYTVHGCNSLDLFCDSRLSRLKKTFLQYVKYRIEKWLLTGIGYDAEISVAGNFLVYPNLNHQIFVIPNGVDGKKFKSKSLKRKTTARRSKVKLLFIGRLEGIKGIDLLLKALEEVKDQLPDFELRIVGDGRERQNLRDLVQRLKMGNKIKFLGQVGEKNLSKEYQQAELFILPSLTEGQPLTLLEAWANKLPVVVTRVGGNSRMVKEGVNGFLAEPADNESLKKALLRALAKRQKWPKIGEKGYNLVKKEYTWDRTVEKILEVYQVILLSSKRRLYGIG